MSIVKRNSEGLWRVGALHRTARMTAVALLLQSILVESSIADLTTRMSVSTGGEQSSSSSASTLAVMSLDGEHVAFVSSATNLVAGISGLQVYVRSRATGVTQCVSVSNATGAGGNALSYFPSISSDGNRVAFSSDASNLVAGDTNGLSDVFLWDRSAPANAALVCVSVSPTGAPSVLGAQDFSPTGSLRPSISADGRYVGYDSDAVNLVANTAINCNGIISGDTDKQQDIYLFDSAAVFPAPRTVIVSLNSSGCQGQTNGNHLDALFCSVSADGRYVAFESHANLSTAPDPIHQNTSTGIYLRDTQANPPTTVFVSVGHDALGQPADHGGACHRPSISDDGRFVAFTGDQNADNLVPGDVPVGKQSFSDIFLWDRDWTAQSPTPQTRRISEEPDGTGGNNDSWTSSISGNGEYVAFETVATNLDDNVGMSAVLIAEVSTGTFRNAQVDSYGVLGNAGALESVFPFNQSRCVSDDGLVVVFTSNSTNLVPNDGNGSADVFVHAFGQVTGTAFCFGDVQSACPCEGYFGDPGHGCSHSFDGGGALLEAFGSPSIGEPAGSSDDVSFTASNMPPTTLALLLQGTASTPGLDGDGLKCVGGTIIRYGTAQAVNGETYYGAPPITEIGLIPAGSPTTRYYQVYYRNAEAFCTADTFNYTNGIAISWVP